MTGKPCPEGCDCKRHDPDRSRADRDRKAEYVWSGEEKWEPSE